MTSRHKLAAPEAFEANVREVCDLYAQAPALHAEGVHVISTHEE